MSNIVVTAPISRIAEHGIVGDAFEVVPASTQAIADIVKHR